MRNELTIWLLIILGFTYPRIINAQNNRLSIQTGLFHEYFDKFPLLNREVIKTNSKFNWKAPHSYFGGYLNESLGFQYQRRVIDNHFIGIEYMSLHAGKMIKNMSPSNVGPEIQSKFIYKVNLLYTFKLKIKEKFNINFTGGFDYIWGRETVYLFTTSPGGWNEPHFTTIFRNDYGVNLRLGFEYSPLKWLTLYTDFDFLGIFYLRKISSKDPPKFLPATKEFFKENYNVNNLPSRWDISWQFGIGFNFGK